MREKKLTRLGTGKSSDMATVTAVPAPVAVPAASVKKAPKEIFAPNSDFYQLADVLIAEEEAIVKELRIHMETKVWPIINSTGPMMRLRSSCCLDSPCPPCGCHRPPLLRGRELRVFDAE